MVWLVRPKQNKAALASAHTERLVKIMQNILTALSIPAVTMIFHLVSAFSLCM